VASGLRHRPADATFRQAPKGIYDVIGSSLGVVHHEHLDGVRS
jgi:hypothetical protein